VGATGATGPQPSLSTATPQGLGTAAAGVGTTASKDDHVHSSIVLPGPSAIGLTIKANATTPGNLQEWQNSAGTVITRVRPDGQIGIGSTLITGTNFFVNNSISTTNVVVTIRGAASQTANLQEWQNSAGTTLASINSAGTARLPIITDVAGTGSLIYMNASNVEINTRSVGNIGLIVSGVASQSANLQEWRNSASTVLSAIDTAGNFTKGDGDQLVLAGQVFG
jgi:hypothetical protein